MGLRERKKQETLRRISAEAIRLFVERGFDRVTIAEVAAAADVSVNTVYNYFPAKEDLVFPGGDALPDRLADVVRTRPVGESAAGAVLAYLREALRSRDREIGLAEGFGRVLAMMLATPALAARLTGLGEQMVRSLAVVLAEETGAAPDDPLPRLVASQIGWLHSLVYGEVGRRVLAGDRPDDIAESTVDLLDSVEWLLGDRIMSYAVRES
ncbi:TetR/AcrR family transcriptional regulator [Amycolatopsis suaedae]|uniref:TetR/AcrR family transcriptional regulator n=1 Tax=Amycolatopsis suaedae TaxID=2510978 RepID=UPI00196B3CCE|nr:TetR family transcriptional regulator [Amycolatopsis suaedae]